MEHKKLVCELEQELEMCKSTMYASKPSSPSPKGDQQTDSAQLKPYFAGGLTACRADYKKV